MINIDKFKFIEDNGLIRIMTISPYLFKNNNIEIFYFDQNLGASVWIHHIKYDEIFWRADQSDDAFPQHYYNSYYISQKAKNYFNKIVKLKAFL